MTTEDLVGVLSIFSVETLTIVRAELEGYRRDASDDNEEAEVERADFVIEALDVVRAEREAIEKTEATH